MASGSMWLLLSAPLARDTAGETHPNLQPPRFNGLTTVLAHTSESLRNPFLSMYQLLMFLPQTPIERQDLGPLH